MAQVEVGGAETHWWNFTTDHLGTPQVATDETGAELWASRLEPFGEDSLRATPDGATENGIFLRLPGQWETETWQDADLGADVYYNVHRWYESGVGRYTKPDPLTAEIAERALYLRGIPDATFAYANSLPTSFIDPLGLEVQIKTPDKEAGLGEAGGGIPGDELPGCRCQATEIVDHTGESDVPGATCRTVPLVDEDCVNRLLEIGKPRGNWLPVVNDCWSFVNAVI